MNAETIVGSLLVIHQANEAWYEKFWTPVVSNSYNTIAASVAPLHTICRTAESMPALKVRAAGRMSVLMMSVIAPL